MSSDARSGVDKIQLADSPRRPRLALNSSSKAVFVMLPVATATSRCGDLASRWLSRRSRSFVTMTRPSGSARSAIRASVVRLPSGSSDVCSVSCPASLRNRAELRVDEEPHAAPSGITR